MSNAASVSSLISMLVMEPVICVIRGLQNWFKTRSAISTGERYRLLAWCVMPNHVHAVAEMLPGFALAHVVHSWKSYMAKEANKMLHREGPFWQREYYDRYIRDDRHLERAIAYIEQNPVKAGLVAQAKEWAFSSAGLRGAGG